jgi:Cft2 family RNA processing exonuclease
MRIHLLGGVDTTGASCLVVEAAGQRVLVDAGTTGTSDPARLVARIHALGGIDAAVVTHAHMDHAGALPRVLAAFPRAPLIATSATLAFLQVLLTDPESIPQSGRTSTAIPKAGPENVPSILARGRPVAFRHRYSLLSKVSSTEGDWWLTLFQAGHVLGAAMVFLETPDGSVLISGDISVLRQHTVSSARFPRHRDVDVLVLESTFGDRGYRPREAEETRIVGVVRSALGRFGHVLVACSAVGVAQEILLILAAARRRKELRDPIWADGTVPAANAVYAMHAAQESTAVARFIHEYGNPFVPQAGLVRVITNQEARDTLLAGPPAIVVSSSANLQTGPSAYYSSQLAQDADNLILLPIQDIRGTLIENLKARCVVDGYSLSTHAGRNELMKLAIQIHARQTILVHGASGARQALAAGLTAQGLVCTIPAEDETFTLDSEWKSQC